MKPGFTLEAAKTSNQATLSSSQGYTLKFSKTFILATRQWQVKFTKQVDGVIHNFEFFLDEDELIYFKASI